MSGVLRAPLPISSDVPDAALTVLSAAPIRTGGASGTRYLLRRPHAVTGHAETDAALSTFEAIVLDPVGRPAAEAPVVTLLNGITRGLDRTLVAGAALASRGVGAVLFDTPLGGRRTLTSGGPPDSLAALARADIRMDAAFASRLFDGVADDFPAVLQLAAERHALREGVEGRLALAGLSFGCLLSAYAFGRDGRGERLLGAIGHPDLRGMALGLAETFARFSGVPAAVLQAGLRAGPLGEAAARRYGGDVAVGAFRLARLLALLGRGGGPNPIVFSPSVVSSRAVAFLAGEADPVAPPDAVRAAASRYPSHHVETVPRLGHGWYPQGSGSFQADLNGFLLRAMGDWVV